MEDLKIVINGAGAAGIAIARYLGKRDQEATNQHIAKEIVMCDTMGIIHKNRLGVNDIKEELLSYTNPRNLIGTINDALLDADVFIGVSKANLLNREHIRSMAKDPLILALANPIPEILPEEAIAGEHSLFVPDDQISQIKLIMCWHFQGFSWSTSCKS